MTSSILTLFGQRTQAQVVAQMYALGASLGVDIVGVQAEAVFRALFEIEALAKSKEESLRVQVAQAGFIDTVLLTGEPAWVDLLAQGWFGLSRAPATYTVGQASLTGGALAIGGNVPVGGARFVSTTGVTFTNAEAFVVVPGTTIPVILRAAVTGTSGNVPVGSITKFTTVLTNCSISNPGTNGSWILSAGIGAESDKSVLARCLARWAATSYGGAASAYRQWVNDAFVAIAQTNTINRIGVDDTNPNGPGSTDIYLANAGGPAGLTELAVVSPFLLARRGLGTGPLRIFAAPSIAIPVIATLYGNTGGAALGAAALASLQAEIPLGGKVYFSALLSLLKDIPGVYNVAMTSPAPGVDTTLPSFDVATFVPTLVALA